MNEQLGDIDVWISERDGAVIFGPPDQAVASFRGPRRKIGVIRMGPFNQQWRVARDSNGRNPESRLLHLDYLWPKLAMPAGQAVVCAMLGMFGMKWKAVEHE